MPQPIPAPPNICTNTEGMYLRQNKHTQTNVVQYHKYKYIDLPHQKNTYVTKLIILSHCGSSLYKIRISRMR